MDTILIYIFFALFLSFTALSYLQLKHIATIYSQLVKEYKGDYFIGCGQIKGNFFKLRKGSITFVVSNDKGDIVDTYIMDGFSVFSRLKRTGRFNFKNIFRDFNEIDKTLAKSAIQESFYMSMRNIMAYMKTNSLDLDINVVAGD